MSSGHNLYTCYKIENICFYFRIKNHFFTSICPNSTNFWNFRATLFAPRRNLGAKTVPNLFLNFSYLQSYKGMIEGTATPYSVTAKKLFEQYLQGETVF